MVNLFGKEHFFMPHIYIVYTRNTAVEKKITEQSLFTFFFILSLVLNGKSNKSSPFILRLKIYLFTSTL